MVGIIINLEKHTYLEKTFQGRPGASHTAGTLSELLQLLPEGSGTTILAGSEPVDKIKTIFNIKILNLLTENLL